MRKALNSRVLRDGKVREILKRVFRVGKIRETLKGGFLGLGR